MGPKAIFLALLMIAAASPGFGESADRMIGGDIWRVGETNAHLEASRDVLAAGATVSLEGVIAGDTHAAGFDVDVDATTGGDLYAAGFSVSLRGPVGGDLSASGFSIRTGTRAEVAGNARLAGAHVTIDGPVLGALAAAGRKVTLNSVVSGDVLLTGETLIFGDDVRIGGTLTYSAPARLNIPQTVVPADRVIFEPFQPGKVKDEAREIWSDWEYPVLPTFLSLLSGFLITLGFFVLIGALFLSLVPKQLRHLRRTIDMAPGKALLAGAIGLSLVFGLVPISALTVIGIPFVPFVLLTTVVVWTLGYILGVYVLSMRAMRGLGAAETPQIWMRLLALVIGVTAMALLNFIPVLGWMMNFGLVLLGVGGMTMALIERMAVDMRPAERHPE